MKEKQQQEKFQVEIFHIYLIVRQGTNKNISIYGNKGKQLVLQYDA
jgi:hypothetical protein